MERDRYARALLREVGDEVPVERVLDEASDWRGRAQQISLLRDKLREASSQQVWPDPQASRTLPRQATVNLTCLASNHSG